MSPILVLYHLNILQQSVAVNWPNQLETKRLCTRASCGIGLIEKIYWLVSFSIRQYCILF